MPSTGPDGDGSGHTERPSPRRLLAALAAGALGATGRTAGRVTGQSGSGLQSTTGRNAETDDASGARDGAGFPLTTGAWRRFQYDPRNAGHAQTGGGPRASAGARWGYREGDSFASTPVVTEDTVYVADAGAGRVVAVDRSDGSERWRVEADVGDGRMTYDDGMLIVPADELEVRADDAGVDCRRFHAGRRGTCGLPDERGRSGLRDALGSGGCRRGDTSRPAPAVRQGVRRGVSARLPGQFGDPRSARARV